MNRRKFFGALCGGAVSLAVPKQWWTEAWKWLVALPRYVIKRRPATIAQTIACQLENVRDKIPTLYESNVIWFTRISKREIEYMYPRRAMRIPMQIRPAGSFTAYEERHQELARKTS